LRPIPQNQIDLNRGELGQNWIPIMMKKIFVLLLIISSSTMNAQKPILPDFHRNSAVHYFVITAFGAKGDGKT